MSGELKNRLFERLPGVPRPDPYTITPSRLSDGQDSGTASPSAPQKNRPIRAARGSYGIFNIVMDNTIQKILGPDGNRCYFEIQNKSTETIYLSFSSGGGQLEIQPLSTWWSNVAPVNDVYVRGPVGAPCTILTASD